jgi:trehalose 6-phosphate synthase
VEAINARWGSAEWVPVVLLKKHYGQTDLCALHRLSRLLVVNSLHDGMNLVAKEFVASRFDEDGVLLLSKFTGAFREIDDAIGINPFAIDETAAAMHHALTMAPAERIRRMQRMREHVREHNVYRWAGKILSTLLRLRLPEASVPIAPELEELALTQP